MLEAEWNVLRRHCEWAGTIAPPGQPDGHPSDGHPLDEHPVNQAPPDRRTSTEKAVANEYGKLSKDGYPTSPRMLRQYVEARMHEHLGQGTEEAVAAMVDKMTSKLSQRSRKPLITMLELVLNGQELEDMEHWDLLQAVGQTVRDCYAATAEADQMADPDGPECMAQAVEHAIYQGWTEVKTAQLALPQPDNQRAAAPIGVSELMEYVAGQLTQMEAAANPDRQDKKGRTRQALVRRHIRAEVDRCAGKRATPLLGKGAKTKANGHPSRLGTVTDASETVAPSGGDGPNHQYITEALRDLAAAWPTTADTVAAMRVSNNASAQVEWLDQCEHRIRSGGFCWTAPEAQFRADDIVRSLATWIWVRLASRKSATTVKVTDRLHQMMCGTGAVLGLGQLTPAQRYLTERLGWYGDAWDTGMMPTSTAGDAWQGPDGEPYTRDQIAGLEKKGNRLVECPTVSWELRLLGIGGGWPLQWRVEAEKWMDMATVAPLTSSPPAVVRAHEAPRAEAKRRPSAPDNATDTAIEEQERYASRRRTEHGGAPGTTPHGATPQDGGSGGGGV